MLADNSYTLTPTQPLHRKTHPQNRSNQGEKAGARPKKEKN